MRDLLVEIFGSIRRNRLRTVLTGFAVSWGIFMLIVLLGVGNGLMNSFMSGGADVLTNTMMIGGGVTSVPYDGLKQGRWIRLEDRDIETTAGKNFADVIDGVSPSVYQSGLNVSYGSRSVSDALYGVYPDYAVIEKMKLLSGRFINDSDIKEKKKVAVLADASARHFLGAGADPAEMIGRRIKADNLMYLVVGIYQNDESRYGSDIFIPYTTLKTVYNKGRYIGELTFSFHGLETIEANEDFEKKYRAAINTNHRAAPDDNGAIWIWNRFKQNLQMEKGTKIISTALWIIGLFTLLGGIVGVSNIMLITVKERTHEFGIRKAIGASPWSIMKGIVTESVIITAFFGYVGMVLGLGVCEILDRTLGQQTMSLFGGQQAILKDPTVGLSVAVGATVVLIVAGTIAGLMPAIKASKVKPIEALRAD
ncbi:MAG: ABC transporter permease [Bacteroidales bacterium]|nr:ABC transporter permease [Bacteroidales bacterium]